MIIPYRADVPMYRWPIANFALIAATCVVSIVAFGATTADDTIKAMILDGWQVTGLFGHILLHAGPLHLIGNMVFLWVFGNAICAKVGNGPFLLIYVGLGFFAGIMHVIFDGDPAVGASGAINGIVGMFLVWYPVNKISCVFLFFFYPRKFEISSMWLILVWLAFDVYGATTGGRGVAYWAHLGGLAAGITLAYALLKSGKVKMTEYERSIIDVLNGRRT